LLVVLLVQAAADLKFREIFWTESSGENRKDTPTPEQFFLEK
jgi:hypothetical protein